MMSTFLSIFFWTCKTTLGRGYGGKASHCPMLLSEIVAWLFSESSVTVFLAVFLLNVAFKWPRSHYRRPLCFQVNKKKIKIHRSPALTITEDRLDWSVLPLVYDGTRVQMSVFTLACPPVVVGYFSFAAGSAQKENLRLRVGYLYRVKVSNRAKLKPRAEYAGSLILAFCNIPGFIPD